MISPRALFRKNEADAKALAIVVNEEWFQRAVAYSLASMAAMKAPQESLMGADLFLNELHGLAEEDKPVETLPDKSNLPSYN